MARQEPEGGLRSAALKGIVWTFIQSIIERTLQAAVFFIVASLIGSVAFGLAAIAIAPAAIFAAVLQGASQAVVQRRELDEHFLASAFTVTIAIGAALSLITGLLAPVLGTLMKAPELRSLVYGSAIVPLLAGLGAVPEGLLTRNYAFKALALRRSFGLLISGSICVALASMGYGAWSMVAQMVSTTLTVSLVSLFICGWRPHFSVTRDALREAASIATILFGTNAVIQGNLRLVDIAIGYVAGPAAAGVFRLARTMMDLVTSVAFNPVANILLPLFSHVAHDESRAAILLKRAISASLLLCCGVGLIVIFAAEPFTALAVRGDWPNLGLTLALLGLVFPTMALSTPLLTYFVSINRPSRALHSNIGQFAVNLVLVTIGSQWGVVGATIAYVIRAYAAFVVMLLYLRLRHQPTLHIVNYRLGLPLLFFLIAALTGLALKHSLGIERDSIPGNVLLLSVVLATYGGLTVILAKAAVVDAICLAPLSPAARDRLRQVPLLRSLII